MKFPLLAATGLFVFLPCVLPAQLATFHTNLGNINVDLMPGVAPQTVANFLTYVNAGAYTNSIFHRSVSGFIIQGGGYTVPTSGVTPVEITQNAAIPLEYNLPNTRGTIAMARTGATDTTTATDQWFFNTVDNTTALGASNSGGYAVFGTVADAASLAVMDKIAAVPVPDPSPFGADSAFSQIPLINYQPAVGVEVSNFVVVDSITTATVGPAPAIGSSGVVSASGFGGYASAAPGSYIEIYGTDLAGTTRSWGTSDFTRSNAPTSLDNVTVTVNGIAAYVYYVSPTQVDVQVPAPVGFPTSGTVPVVLSYFGQASNSVNLTMNATEGGLLATSLFHVNGKQYVEATHLDGTLVAPSGIGSVAASPAKPGETIVFYGLGFGPVSPASTPIAGYLASGQSYLSATVVFSFNKTNVFPAYSGLAPGFVGLYQFNVTVPANAASGDVAVVVTEGGTALAQTLYLPVGD